MNNVENEIIRGLQKGNRDIFNIVFKSFYSLLCVYANDLVKSYAAAREIVQDVFVKLWENHSRLRIQTSLKSYLYKSVYYASLNYLRNNKRRSLHQTNLDNTSELEILVTEEPDWINTPERLELMEEKIKTTIDHLPDQCRQIFILCRFDHLSYPQIAEKLSISLSTVKTQMGRAMAKLKEALEKE